LASSKVAARPLVFMTSLGSTCTVIDENHRYSGRRAGLRIPVREIIFWFRRRARLRILGRPRERRKTSRAVWMKGIVILSFAWRPSSVVRRMGEVHDHLTVTEHGAFKGLGSRRSHLNSILRAPVERTVESQWLCCDSGLRKFSGIRLACNHVHTCRKAARPAAKWGLLVSGIQ
jgi:hypothetical protein